MIANRLHVHMRPARVEAGGLPTASSRSAFARHRSRLIYAGVAAVLLAAVLELVFSTDAGWWQAVAFALLPDLAVWGQLHPRAVPLHNALHRPWGPLALGLVAVIADLPLGWVAGAITWEFHVALDRAIGLRLRSPDGFQQDDKP